jgi:glycosyltransferase involved in cell wall biosynthesis
VSGAPSALPAVPDPAQRPIAVCIVAHLAYGALAGKRDGHIGGVEHQTALLARWLAARGHRVSLVTWDEGQPDGAEIAGVRVIRLCRRDQGLPGLRFLHPRWTSLNRALRRAGADLYYQNCGEYVTGQVALWCRWHGRPFVYSAAADADCDSALPRMRTLRERILYRLGLRWASQVIVQTATQQEMLRRGFGRDSVVAPMPCPEPPGPAPGPRPARPGAVLWIGRLCEVKRPDRLLDLARACPDLQFDLVGPADGSPYARAVLERARGIPNLTVHGPATREEVPAFYRGAACLCSTSDREGFPNTFLEAWSHGVPVVSTFDPDGLIATHGLGASARDVPGLAAALRALLSSPDRWSEASASARRYWLDHHALDRAMPRFEQIFLDTVAASGRHGHGERAPEARVAARQEAG